MLDTTIAEKIKNVFITKPPTVNERVSNVEPTKFQETGVDGRRAGGKAK